MYVDKNNEDVKSLESMAKIMKRCGHDEFVKEICDHLILNKVQKTNAVWIHGAANSGKTCFLKRLQAIFDCAEYQQTRGKFNVKEFYKTIVPLSKEYPEIAMSLIGS